MMTLGASRVGSWRALLRQVVLFAAVRLMEIDFAVPWHPSYAV
jgi:hypothetical protein